MKEDEVFDDRLLPLPVYYRLFDAINASISFLPS